MCGIAGIAGARLAPDVLGRTVATMAETLAHRGPDDQGVWTDAAAGVGLGHRRLAVLDLSPAGHQPMHSASGRWAVVFNGEIYNHRDLRSELERSGRAPQWRGHSDTETLLALVDALGVERAVEKLVGMFAIALWDRRDRSLHLLRDRVGEKPLYYGWSGTSFVFASELKALGAFPGFQARIDRDALAAYLRFTYVPAPLSILQGVYKLEPGCHLIWSGACAAPCRPLRPGDSHHTVSVRRWWSLSDVVERGAADPIGDESEAVAALEAALGASVQRQMISDVPLGAFLSGGIDSSTVVALMQYHSRTPVRTFTIGFDEAGFDEAPHAAAVARHLGTDHTEFRVAPSEAREVIPELPRIYDEPFADSSQLPTALVCRVARQQVTVALSGDGGDELFGGYNRYLWGPRLWIRLSWIPYPLRAVTGAAVGLVPIPLIDRLVSVLPGGGMRRHIGARLHKLGERLTHARSVDDLYFSLISEWQPSEVLQTDDAETDRMPIALNDPLPGESMQAAEHRMMFRDSLSYLPDDILCKVDRAAMATSLETRVPFLDPAVVALAWRLPLSMKIRNGQGKWILRQLLYRYVPRELIERPKAGFAIPVGVWLRGPLRDWAENLLDPARLNQQGLFATDLVQKVWKQHLTGRYDWTPRLWAVLMFQAWRMEQAACVSSR